MTKDKKIIRIKAKIKRVTYPKPASKLGEGPDYYGVTTWEIKEVKQGKEFLSEAYREYDEGLTTEPCVTIVGDFVTKIEKKNIYTIVAEKTVNPKYGIQYKLKYILYEIDYSDVRNQNIFLRNILTVQQYNKLFEKYENPWELVVSHNKEALMKVSGIGQATADRILEKYDANIDNFAMAIELDGCDISQAMQLKIRECYSSEEKAIEVIKNDPYRLCRDVDGIGFKTADKIAMKVGIDPKSVIRAKALIEYTLEKAGEEGQSYLTPSALTTKMYFIIGGRENIYQDYVNDKGEVTGNNIKQAMRELTEGEDSTVVLEAPQGVSNYRRVYLKKYYDLEYNIAKELHRLTTAKNKFDITDWEDNISKYESQMTREFKADGKNIEFKFTEEQMSAIELALENNVCFITGGAGTGKSSVVGGMLAALKGYTHVQTCLSGKAAARLEEVTHEPGYTIHRLIKYNDISKSSELNITLPYDIIILDEISMVGGEIFLSLLQAIRSGTKLIMLGDKHQLESIGSLNIAKDLFESPQIATYELKQIHRQAAQSGILSTSQKIRNQYQLCSTAYEGVLTYGADGDMVFDLSRDDYDNLEKTMRYFKAWLNTDIVKGNVNNIQLISPVKERGGCNVYDMNIEAQKICNPYAQEENFHLVSFINEDKKTYNIYLNDKVMCIKNNYKAVCEDDSLTSIYNGWVGIVKKVDRERNLIYVDFQLNQNGKLIVFGQKDIQNSLILGYASTVHKLQGSSAKVVIGVVDNSAPPSMLTCQLLYTLITRAEKACVVVGETGAICRSISQNAVSLKHTFLPELLEKVFKNA